MSHSPCSRLGNMIAKQSKSKNNLKQLKRLALIILLASFPAKTFWLLSNCFMGSSMRFKRCLTM